MHSKLNNNSRRIAICEVKSNKTTANLIAGNTPPGGVSLLSGSLIKKHVYQISRRDATVAYVVKRDKSTANCRQRGTIF